MVHPYANPAGYMSASRDTLSSQGYGPKRGEDCRPPRRKRFSALSFMNMRNSKDLSLPGARPSPITTVLSPTSTIVAPSPARSRAPSVSRSRAPSVSHSRAPSAPSAILSTPQPIASTPQPIASTPPSIVRKPSSGSRRGRDPPFIVKSSQHCTFEVALPAKTRDGGAHSRTARSVPRAIAHHEQSRTGSRYEQSTMRQDQSMTARSVTPRIARVTPPSIARVPPPSIAQVPPPSVAPAPSITRPSPPSTARSSPPSTAHSSPPSTTRSTTIYGSPSIAHSSPTLVSTPVNSSAHANASSPNLATTWRPVADPDPNSHHTNLASHAATNTSSVPRSNGAPHAYPDDTWSFFTPPTPAVPRFSFNWHGQPGRRGRMRLYGAQIKHYGVRFRLRVKHSMRGARARQMKGKVITTYGKTRAKGKILERQIVAGAKEASQFVRQVALAVKQEIREMRSSTAER